MNQDVPVNGIASGEVFGVVGVLRWFVMPQVNGLGGLAKPEFMQLVEDAATVEFSTDMNMIVTRVRTWLLEQPS